MNKNTSQTDLSQPRFDKRFLESHAGKIISDPKVAIVELVANSWDAGATKIHLTWPVSPAKYFEILDNGEGMTENEFEERWYKFNYDRLKSQGSTVKISNRDQIIERKVYGKNGKGRYSLFCFSNKYTVETCKDGSKSIFEVIRSYEDLPYKIRRIETIPANEHGTKISCSFNIGLDGTEILGVDTVRELLGSKFIADPSSFEIFVNNEKIDYINILNQAKEFKFEIPNEGIVKIYVIDSKTTGKTAKQHGVAWWVNNRLVGEQSWKDFNDSYLDERIGVAKRYTIIVLADILENDIKEDWTGFEDTDRVINIKEHIKNFILGTVAYIMQDIRKETKIDVLRLQRTNLNQMSHASRNELGFFIDQVLIRCPTIKQENLKNVVDILAKMETCKSSYKLLQQLAQQSPDNMDAFSAILDEWDIMDAKMVLDELRDRLEIIKKMESLVEDPKTDELHELQPLFEHGLWIFGPEYESIDFLSNKTLATVIKTFFDKKGVKYLKNPRERPDFVALDNGSIGVYSSDRFDENTSEVNGIHKVLIVELKKGGSIIKVDQRREGEDYSKEIRKCGKIDNDTKIVCYVLGSRVDEFCGSMKEKNIEVIPTAYSTILRMANARTFNLIQKIKDIKQINDFQDKEVEEVLYQKTLNEPCRIDNSVPI